MLAPLRPHPHRGDPLAAGVVVLTVAILLVSARFDDEWARGVHVVYTSVAAALVLAMAALSSVPEERARPYVSVLCVTAFALTLVALLEWAELLAGEDTGAGTVTWVGLLLTTLAAVLARDKRAPIMTVISAAAGTVTLLAFVDWAFSPDDTVSTFRYLLLLVAVAFVLAAVRLRDARRRHAVAFVDVAGLAIVAIGATLLVESFVGALFGGFLGQGAEALLDGAAWGWELVLLSGAFGLIAYGQVDREAGPGYIGVTALGLFVVVAALPGDDGPSLIGWPLLLLVLGGALVAVALRPRRDLPPEPSGGATGPDDDDAVVRVRVS